jgi:23S rRNA U2552 (ribose-2'-O)-methylase RlmE/FtsJ
MLHMLLPRTHTDLYKNIEYSENNNHSVSSPSFISNSLYNYLIDIKSKIDLYETQWNEYKRYTNPYEFIHTNISAKKKCVSKYRPLSRSFFKMTELAIFFQLNINSTAPIKTFHLAEGPGGFIEAIATMRNRSDDSYVGMTLLDDANNTNIPAWKKSNSFLQNNKNVRIENGMDGTGNILSINNFVYINEMYGSSMDLITADGGFDFSFDFDNQETNMSKLLYGQIVYALCMQKHGGNFVLKIFDCFMQQTIDILHILSSFYEHVYITKPQTSRYANSEKYVVCKGFLKPSSYNFYPYLFDSFKAMLESPNFACRFLNIPISYYFISKLEEYNAIFGQQQIEYIHSTILLIENKYKENKIENLVKININKCIQWCVKYNVPYNTFISSGMFVSQSCPSSDNSALA